MTEDNHRNRLTAWRWRYRLTDSRRQPRRIQAEGEEEVWCKRIFPTFLRFIRLFIAANWACKCFLFVCSTNTLQPQREGVGLGLEPPGVWLQDSGVTSSLSFAKAAQCLMWSRVGAFVSVDKDSLCPADLDSAICLHQPRCLVKSRSRRVAPSARRLVLCSQLPTSRDSK